MLFLLEFYEQFMTHFFLWSIVSTKKLSGEGKLWFKTLARMSSRIYKIIPPPKETINQKLTQREAIVQVLFRQHENINIPFDLFTKTVKFHFLKS